MGLLDDISSWLGGDASSSAPLDASAAATPDLGGDLSTADVGAGWPSLASAVSDLGGASSSVGLTYGGGAMVTPTMGVTGTAIRGLGALAARISPVVASAIVKISQRLGGAGGSIAGYGRRVWSQLSTWAAKNPGVSLVATLVSLGLTVEEAAHFIAWGATNRRKRRSRGISGRELRTTRRTIRKLQYFSSLLSTVCPPRMHHRRRASFSARHRRR